MDHFLYLSMHGQYSENKKTSIDKTPLILGPT
jgi:hypothetical protein